MTGLRDEVGKEPQAEQTGDKGDDARRDRERDGQGSELIPVRGDIGDCRGGKRGGGGHRADDQVLRTAERRVEQQRCRRGVEADHR